MATPNNELPVWPFQPNWSEGILERLSWSTMVMPSETTGAEQRSSTRLSPRREFEVTFNPVGDTRTFFDLFISTLGGQEMMIPLWHDRHKLSSPIEDGDNRVDCDTIYGEFMDGGMAILVGPDVWSHRVLEIETVDLNGFTLSAAPDFDWPSGALVLPLRRSRIDLQPSLNNLTSRVGEAAMRFILNQANDLPDNGVWAGMTYEGYPVVTMESDWADGIDIGFSRITETEDNGTGLAFIRDIAERAFRTKKHTWHVVGREDNWTFRQFLYRMAGRRVPVWMPTGNQDLAVSVTANAGQGSAQVRKVGFSYIGGPKPGRDRALARTGEGYQIRRITGMGAPTIPAYERINFDTNLTYALPAGTNLSFLEIMRAEGDNIELMHHTDTEGVTECSINFASFSNTRVAAQPISVPVPSGDIEYPICNVPGPDEDFCIRYYPYTLLIKWTWAPAWDLQGYDPPVYIFEIPQAVTAGMMPNGRTFNKHDNVAGGVGAPIFVPELGFSLNGYRDNNNPDGSPGGPVVGWRMLGPVEARSGIECYFFFPISTDPADRQGYWTSQFGHPGFPNPSPIGNITVSDGVGNILTSVRRDPVRLFPARQDFPY